jgi:exopolyphosphatase/guanosine-5'-triphosphate,3'-diphosphate pyrophosphatase
LIASADLLEATATPEGHRMGNGPVGVIDLGSNSVRLVLYERASRAPTVLFNEKVLAGLGEGLSETGRLSDAAMARALGAVARFMAISRAAGVRDVTIVATAAARDASNGADFIARIEAESATKVRVLDGREEARMAASGVLCGFWRPDGVVGDLGGGSLELIDVGEHGLGPGDSFPLGTLRLKGDAKGSLPKAAGIVEKTLSDMAQLPLMAGRTFYAVGGTWRSLFRLHMAETRYPISVMHHYRVAAPDILAFCDRILKNSLDTMAKANVVSKGRRPLVPWGAAVMRALVAEGRPKEVVASALGVREGLLYHGLDREERVRDPLILAAEELAVLRGRSPLAAAELVDWTARLFTALGIGETEEERRLRVAACLMSDIGWRAHPDYRGDQAIAIVANSALYGVDHAGRGFLASVLYDRYGGLANPPGAPGPERLCPPRLVERARLLAGAFRLAYVISPGIAGILPRTRTFVEGERLVLWLPEDLSALAGERPLRRMRNLAKQVDLEGTISTLAREAAPGAA